MWITCVPARALAQPDAACRLRRRLVAGRRTLIAVAITYSGLAALGVPEDSLQGFPEALQVGMASHTRASRLRRQRPEALGAGARKWGNPYRCQRLQRLGGDVAQHDGHGAAAL